MTIPDRETCMHPAGGVLTHTRILWMPLVLAGLLLPAVWGRSPAMAQTEPPPGWQPDTLQFQSSDTLRMRPARRSTQPPPPPNLEQFQRALQSESDQMRTEQRMRVQEFRRQLGAARQFEFVGQHERALDLYRTLLDQDSSNRQAFDGVRRNLVSLEDYPAAEALLRRELRQMNAHTSKADILAELGAVLWQAGREEEARAAWDDAIDAPPRGERSYQEVASAQLQLRLIEDAISTYERGRDELNDPSLFAIHLAGLHVARMDWPAATDEYIHVLRTGRHRLHYIQRGLANFPDQPDANEAVIDAIERELRANDPPWPGYAIILRELRIDQHKKNANYAAALADVAALDDLTDAGGVTLLRFSVEAMEEGFERVAEDALDEAALRMDNPEGRDMIALLRGSLHEERGEIELAAEAFSTVAADPSTDDVERAARMSRGMLRLRHLANPAGAVDDFRRVRALGWPAADRELDYVQAVALIQLDSLQAALEPLQRQVPRAEGRQQPTGVLAETVETGEITTSDLSHLAARVMLWAGDRDHATALMDSLLSPTTGVASENETLHLLHLHTSQQDTVALELFAAADRAEFQGDVERALTLYDSLASSREDSDLLAIESAFASAMLRLRALGDPGAIPAFATRFSGQPRVEDAWYQLGLWWLEQGDPDEAAVAFEMVLMEAPDGLLHGLARLRLDELTVPLFLEGEDEES